MNDLATSVTLVTHQLFLLMTGEGEIPQAAKTKAALRSSPRVLDQLLQTQGGRTQLFRQEISSWPQVDMGAVVRNDSFLLDTT